MVLRKGFCSFLADRLSDYVHVYIVVLPVPFHEDLQDGHFEYFVFFVDEMHSSMDLTVTVTSFSGDPGQCCWLTTHSSQC